MVNSFQNDCESENIEISKNYKKHIQWNFRQTTKSVLAEEEGQRGPWPPWNFLDNAILPSFAPWKAENYAFSWFLLCLVPPGFKSLCKRWNYFRMITKRFEIFQWRSIIVKSVAKYYKIPKSATRTICKHLVRI